MIRSIGCKLARQAWHCSRPSGEPSASVWSGSSDSRHLDPVYLLSALVFFSLGWLQLLYPKDLVPLAAIPLALLPATIAGRGPGAQRPSSLTGSSQDSAGPETSVNGSVAPAENGVQMPIVGWVRRARRHREPGQDTVSVFRDRLIGPSAADRNDVVV